MVRNNLIDILLGFSLFTLGSIGFYSLECAERRKVLNYQEFVSEKPAFVRYVMREPVAPMNDAYWWFPTAELGTGSTAIVGLASMFRRKEKSTGKGTYYKQ